MKYEAILPMAEEIRELLRPHCERIEIAGSIRRKKPDCGDMEIVAIPKPYDTGLFATGIAAIVGQWRKVKGEFPCKYIQRILPSGVVLDLFLAEPDNWGMILAIRTGSAEFSHKVLATGWVKRGYKGEGGYLWQSGRRYEHPEEIDVFKRCQLPWVEPEDREIEQYIPHIKNRT